MGPRSENRGYGDPTAVRLATVGVLQWVHGPRTVVMESPLASMVAIEAASMGPRSENRG